MFELLEKLRAKPEKTRKKIVAVTTAVIVGVIFTFWLIATVYKIEHPPVTASSTAESLTAGISNIATQAQNKAPAVNF